MQLDRLRESLGQKAPAGLTAAGMLIPCLAANTSDVKKNITYLEEPVDRVK